MRGLPLRRCTYPSPLLCATKGDRYRRIEIRAPR